MQGYYDEVIALAAGRPTSAIDPAVLDVLRIGTHQLLATRVPTHAAVYEQVALARRVAPKAAGFANAVLRTISRSSPEAWRELVAEGAKGDDDRLARLESHPRWIVRALRAALQHEGRADELTELLEADNASPRVNLAVLPGLDVDVDDIAGLEPDRYSPIGVVADDPIGVAEASGGRIRVQDEGSQLAALALDARRARARRASGGSTSARARAARPPCSRPRRWPPVRRWSPTRWSPPGPSSCARPSPGCRRPSTCTSATAATSTSTRSAPRAASTASSSTRPARGSARSVAVPRRAGASRRRTSPTSRGCRASCSTPPCGALAPGGILAYVTCSPHTAETHGSLAAALERWQGRVEQLDTRAVVQGLSRHPLDLAGDAETVQLWPHRHGTDAMFIALVRRTEADAPDVADAAR